MIAATKSPGMFPEGRIGSPQQESPWGRAEDKSPQY